jgi:two-component system, OmpR family, sensor histidine kinase VicK
LNGYQRIELRHLVKSIQTRLTTIVADKELSLVIEEKEDEDAIGLATYSNSESTVLSYASIFENLWIQSEIRQQ